MLLLRVIWLIGIWVTLRNTSAFLSLSLPSLKHHPLSLDIFSNSAGRSKVRNVISLEVSNTPLGSQIVPPRAIRDMDWIENIWPSKLKKQGYYPQVQRYCLMSVENCWTDWHVDFAASSVWYFICRGGKTFYFIRPTQENLKAYEQWSSSSERQENTWLGDHVDAVYQVELEAGNTMIIPSGWIHAVFTPQDSLVFGGNFLHSLNISTQLELYRVEVQTKVPRKFRFPHFITFLWFVTKHYYDRLLPLSPQSKARSQSEQKMEPLPPERLPQDVPLRVLRGLKALSFFMLGQARRLDKTLDESEFTDSQRKIARENWPKEQIKNPIELARVFRTLILRILGDTEDLPPPVPTLSQVDALPKTNKNKRKSTDYQPYRASSHRPKSYVAPLVIDPESRQNSREETTYEVLPRPLSKDEPDSGPEELAEVRTLHYVTEATRTVFGQERVIREVRTKTEHVRRIIWTGKPPPNTHVDPLEDTEMLPSNAQSSRTPTESEDVMEQQENKGLSPQHDLLDILATQSAQLDGRSKASAPIADAIEDSNTHSSSQKDPAQEISAVDAQDIKSEPVPSSATN